jgi:hypothetical protein
VHEPECGTLCQFAQRSKLGRKATEIRQCVVIENEVPGRRRGRLRRGPLLLRLGGGAAAGAIALVTVLLMMASLAGVVVSI